MIAQKEVERSLDRYFERNLGIPGQVLLGVTNTRTTMCHILVSVAVVRPALDFTNPCQRRKLVA